ncbi:30S ribosomal protein S5 [Raphidocelis subcapitata]|uniref:Small ribosomal subunit protein uS5c n=1 Tax=Raphidocelis subcapitata TaxID=307507 RepID=A0A2V0P384_9CHLO|nr:30S ribosomal protein S5 [Raphidocelis subcapitata]|eukprot:GBF92310.1 30S ribosomal protein S5 [Raphidocelis subcapitata]
MALTTAARAGSIKAAGPRQRFGVKPFGSRPCRRVVASRAAEEEAAPAEAAPAAEAPAAALVEESFSFNFNEARRGNSYEASDVAAAMDYYANGAGDLPYEADFAVNRFGTEDAAFFDDIDNNEGYASSEYLSVGIEEAAPKTKSRQRDEDEAFDAALEEFDSERAASAAFEGVEVLDASLLDDTDDADAPWTWEDGGAAAAPSAAAAAGGEEDALLAQLAAIDFDALRDEDAETRELASMVVDALGDDLDLVAAADAGPDVAAPKGLSAEDEAIVAEVLALDADAAPPAVDPSLAATAAAIEAEGLASGAGPALPQSDVDDYLATLRAIDAAAAGGSADALEGVRKEAVGPVGAVAAPEDVAAPALPKGLSAPDAPFADLPAALAAGGADDDALLAAFGAELAEVEAIPVADYSNPLGSAALFPEEADLEAYEAVLDATGEYMAAAGDELTSELFEDGPDDAAINPYDELDESLVSRGPLVAFDEDGDSNFQERILELSRVTKVVKGGKLMGFRAVAVIGDGKGRVGVGCQSGREVATATKRALVDAKKNLVRVPLVGAGTVPHRVESWFKAAGVVIVPAREGTGVIAGGAVRSVLELAGVQNVLAKRLGSRSMLNNARVTVQALSELRTLDEVARARDLPLQALLQ